jgi:hypothetical protein
MSRVRRATGKIPDNRVKRTLKEDLEVADDISN